jgi:iron complex outermembrane receptor protein
MALYSIGADPIMKQTVLSLSLNAMFAAGAVYSAAAAAQEAAPMQRVEITGSSIKRLQAETANPISIIKAEEFTRQGVTTVQEALTRIPSSQSGMGSGNVVGGNYSGLPTGGQASADLRGLGGDKTLVLLNGRRLANHPYDSASVDLNMIPISALDRVEVLRDGASAIYGTDAIGGVINFITKRSVTTTTISAEVIRPRLAGGDEERVNLSSGFGALDTDGFNVLGVIDWHRQQAITSQQRAFSQTGIVRERGLDVTSGTTFPANYYDALTDRTGNPSFATGCNPPFSVPDPGGTTCRQDYTRQIDNTPDQEQIAVFVKGSKKVGDGHTATLELLHSRNDVTSRTAPPPQTGLILPATSPYYPAGASGGPLSVNWRPLEAGQRTIDSEGRASRIVAAMDGQFGVWEYKAGLSHAISKSSEDFVGGYVQDAAFAAGVANGSRANISGQHGAARPGAKRGSQNQRAGPDRQPRPDGAAGRPVGRRFRSGAAPRVSRLQRQPRDRLAGQQLRFVGFAVQERLAQCAGVVRGSGGADVEGTGDFAGGALRPLQRRRQHHQSEGRGALPAVGGAAVAGVSHHRVPRTDAV